MKRLFLIAFLIMSFPALAQNYIVFYKTDTIAGASYKILSHIWDLKQHKIYEFDFCGKTKTSDLNILTDDSLLFLNRKINIPPALGTVTKTKNKIKIDYAVQYEYIKQIDFLKLDNEGNWLQAKYFVVIGQENFVIKRKFLVEKTNTLPPESQWFVKNGQNLKSLGKFQLNDYLAIFSVRDTTFYNGTETIDIRNGYYRKSGTDAMENFQYTAEFVLFRTYGFDILAKSFTAKSEEYNKLSSAVRFYKFDKCTLKDITNDVFPYEKPDETKYDCYFELPHYGTTMKCYISDKNTGKSVQVSEYIFDKKAVKFVPKQ